MSRITRRIDALAWPFLLAATLASSCGGEIDPYRTLTPLERHIYLEPTAVAIALDFTRVVGGYDSSCMLTGDGQAWCWGPMGALLGFGSEANPTSPVAVVGGHRFQTLAVGGVATCGITQAGQPLCWGMNNTGAVGQSNVDP